MNRTKYEFVGAFAGLLIIAFYLLMMRNTITDLQNRVADLEAASKVTSRPTVATTGNATIDLDARPFTPERLSLAPEADQLANRARGIFTFDPSKVKLHLDPGQKDGKTIRGTELKVHLAALPPGKILSAHVLDFLLAHPELIPDSWKGKAVFFWGTIYRDAVGSLYVRCLDWGGASWDWDCHRLDFDWIDGDLALLAS